jgi:hypothetical protein
MRVKIGPYKNWIGPYQLAEKLCFWVKPVKDEYGVPTKPDWVHKFGEWLAHGSIRPDRAVGDETDLFSDDRPNTWLYKFLMWIERKKNRKISVHIDRWDTWSMDNTLAYIILPMLKQLKETKHGSPYVDDVDVPEYLRNNSPNDKEFWDGSIDDNHHARWDWVLDEMIFAFETEAGELQDWEEQFTTGKYDFRFKKISEDGTSEMVQGPNHTAETDWDGRKAYAERIQNGFRLFGKYYQALWD